MPQFNAAVCGAYRPPKLSNGAYVGLYLAALIGPRSELSVELETPLQISDRDHLPPQSLLGERAKLLMCGRDGRDALKVRSG